MITQIKKFAKFIINLFYSILVFKNYRIYINNHLTRGLKYIKRKNVKFPHPIGIVIGQGVILGENCVVYQNVTIGTKDTQDPKNAKYPRIGNNVIIYPNSVVVGDISIGNNVIIGAGSVVIHDVEDNAVVVGNPAKKIK